MPFYRVNKAGNHGFVSDRDQRPYELPPNGWNLISNARMLNGMVESVLSWERNVDLGDIEAHALDYYTDPATGAQWIYAYSDTKIISVDATGTPATVSTGLTDINYPDDVWITDQLNGIPIATNGRDAPQCFYNGGGAITPTTQSQDFPDWDTGGTYEGATARIVRAYKNFIVALNITDVNAYPNMVAWSDAAEPGLMPASWDYNDTTNLAGRTVLGAESGAIIGAKVLRDSLFIYTEYSTYRMDFIGGTFVMRFTRVFENSGAFGPRSIAVFQEKHFVISKSDIVIHDGQQMVSVGDERVRNRILENLTEEDVNRVWVNTYLRFSEIVCGIPRADDNIFHVALVWQWEERAWSVRDLPDARYMKELPILDANEAPIVDTWEGGRAITWVDLDNIWDEGGAVGDLQPMIVSTDGWLSVLDAGVQTVDTIAEREDINLSGDESQEMAVNLYPRMRGETPIDIQVGASNTVEGTVVWGRAIPFDPKTGYKVTARARGRRHAVRFQGKGFSLEGYDIEWTPSGAI